MPNIVLRLPEGVLDENSRRTLVASINSVAAATEQIPDDPKARFMCWVAIEEIAPGNWTCGGADVTNSMIPIIMLIHVPAGVLDAPARKAYVAALQSAVTSALANDQRRVLISCIFNEVENGHWGVNGNIWHLQDFAQYVGFKHLQHLVPQQEAA